MTIWYVRGMNYIYVSEKKIFHLKSNDTIKSWYCLWSQITIYVQANVECTAYGLKPRSMESNGILMPFKLTLNEVVLWCANLKMILQIKFKDTVMVQMRYISTTYAEATKRVNIVIINIILPKKKQGNDKITNKGPQQKSLKKTDQIKTAKTMLVILTSYSLFSWLPSVGFQYFLNAEVHL